MNSMRIGFNFRVFRGKAFVQEGSQRVLVASGRQFALTSADQLSISIFDKKNSSTRTYIGSAECDRKLWRKLMPGTGSLITGPAGTDLLGTHVEIHSMCDMAIFLPRPTSWAATGVAPAHSPDSTRPVDHSVPRSAR